MSGKAIVLDANILIRAVLGKRVRELIFDSVITVKFFAPDIAYADARNYLPALLKSVGLIPVQECWCWIGLRVLCNPLMRSSMQACNSRPCNASQFVMRMTGLYWLVQ